MGLGYSARAFPLNPDSKVELVAAKLAFPHGTANASLQQIYWGHQVACADMARWSKLAFEDFTAWSGRQDALIMQLAERLGCTATRP